MSDVAWMARALAVAERGRHHVRPNPLVGCVLVRDGDAVAEGWTQRPPGQHAEVHALERAGAAAIGATAYVTLEPCNHHGRTPPCAEALLAAGVARVVYGLTDPNPVAAGGARRLTAGGVAVTGDVLAPWVAVQNEVFLHGIRHARPYVTLKLAQTVDGALAVPGRRWVTGPSARWKVHRERARVDAVLVGSGTILADDPRLDVRDVAAPGGQPRPIVLDARGRTPADAAVMGRGALVVTTADGAAAAGARWQGAGAEVVVVPAGATGGVDLPTAMVALWEHGVAAVLAEPGATLAAALITAGVVDRLLLHVAGADGGSSGPMTAVSAVVPAASWTERHRLRLGGDVEIERIRHPVVLEEVS